MRQSISFAPPITKTTVCKCVLVHTQGCPVDLHLIQYILQEKLVWGFYQMNLLNFEGKKFQITKKYQVNLNDKIRLEVQLDLENIPF